MEPKHAQYDEDADIEYCSHLGFPLLEAIDHVGLDCSPLLDKLQLDLLGRKFEEEFQLEV